MRKNPLFYALFEGFQIYRKANFGRKKEVFNFTWAVFSSEGEGTSIQDLERRIVTDWLPTSGYEYADGLDVEVYLNADPMNMKYEVWIPIVKKQHL